MMRDDEGLTINTYELKAGGCVPFRTALDLVSEISCLVRGAMPGELAEEHMQKIRLGMGDMTRYFGETRLDSLSVEWLLAVSPEKVARRTSPAGSCLDFCECVHRIRLVQVHACAFGFHAPAALEMLLIESYAAQLRREEACRMQCAQQRLV